MTRHRRPAHPLRPPWLALTLALVAAAASVQAQDLAPAPATATVTVTSGRATSPTAVVQPYAWRGRETAIEAFLRTAPVTHWRDIPVGITRPRRGFFAPGGPVASMAWKPLPTGLLHGKMESYRSEIAAYLLSRHLGLDLVPPVVERRIDGVPGAAVYWVEGVKRWEPNDPPRNAGANWSRQTSRMFMFDQLIANIDRNQGNLLHDAAANIYLIDHSRAFTAIRHLGGLKPPQQFDRALWARMAALTRPELDALLGAWLTGPQLAAMLVRRDAMATHIARQVRERGDQITFLPAPPATPGPLPATSY